MVRDTLYVVLDSDFSRAQGVASSNRSHYDLFGRRYTAVFKNVFLVCRVNNREEPDGLPVTGPGVCVIELPPIRGWSQLLFGLPALLRALLAIPRDAAVILRVPGWVPSIAFPILLLRRIPFGVEVMADAYQLFAPGAYRRSGRAIYRAFLTQLQRWQCRFATASAYVTARALQECYPPAVGRVTVSYTTLELPPSAIAAAPRTPESFRKARPVIVNVAQMQKHLKGQDVIIKAMGELKKRGRQCELWLVGDGDTRQEFETLVSQLGLTDTVKFLGRVRGGAEVFNILDRSDLFVLPSIQEGLPRAVIEAMARGLPCFASDLPGNRELLLGDYIIPSRDPVAWADRLETSFLNPAQLSEASRRNIALAERYVITTVEPIRNGFYRTLQYL
jgi:glycosyltransferase involved in cell wall biosynthesis